ncbi:MAG: DUF3106 domain-containing protein [Bryobacteraceae bacterium]|jgi:phage-related protein
MGGFRFAIAAMLVCGASSPLAAQQKEKPAKPPAAKPPPASPQQKAAVKRLNENPAKELDRFTNMSPEAREKELSKLPPQRRAAFEQRLARYQQMTPEQQEKFKEKLEIMRKLPKDRQNAVRQQIEQLRAMPFAERKRALNSEEFKQSFSPDEQKLVRETFPNVKIQD